MTADLTPAEQGRMAADQDLADDASARAQAALQALRRPDLDPRGREYLEARHARLQSLADNLRGIRATPQRRRA